MDFDNIKVHIIKRKNAIYNQIAIITIDLTDDDENYTIKKPKHINSKAFDDDIVDNNPNHNKIEEHAKENILKHVLKLDQNINAGNSKVIKSKRLLNLRDEMNGDKIKDTAIVREFNDINIKLDGAVNKFNPKDNKSSSKEISNQIDKMNRYKIKDTVTVRKFPDKNVKIDGVNAYDTKELANKPKILTDTYNKHSHETKEINNLCTTVIMGDVVLTNIEIASKYLEHGEVKNTPISDIPLETEVLDINTEEETYNFQEIKYVFNFDDWLNLLKAKSQISRNDDSYAILDDSYESDGNITVNANFDSVDEKYSRQKPAISESSSSEDNEGYDSSDFEFITEDEAKLGGIIKFSDLNSPINYNNQLAIAGPSRNIAGNGFEDNSIEHYNIPQGSSFVKLFEDTYQESQLRQIQYLENKCVTSIPTAMAYDIDEPCGNEVRTTRSKTLRTYPVNKRRRL